MSLYRDLGLAYPDEALACIEQDFRPLIRESKGYEASNVGGVPVYADRAAPAGVLYGLNTAMTKAHQQLREGLTRPLWSPSVTAARPLAWGVLSMGMFDMKQVYDLDRAKPDVILTTPELFQAYSRLVVNKPV